jgi:hypothetical protein
MSKPGMRAPTGALIALSAAIFIAMSGVAAAQSCPYTPAVGSSERKAIMDAVRGPVQDYLKLPVVFVAKKFAACRGWAFLEAEPQMSNGRPLNWAATPFAADMAEGMCGGYIHALLVKQNGRWRVRDLAVCATDVPWVTWPKDFGAPPELFPYIE